MLNFYIVLCLGFAVALADNIPVHDCGSKLAKLTKIDITPCPSIPCDFKRGTTINVTLDFEASASITNATSKVYGIIAGVPVPFPLDDPDACHMMNCPIKSGDKVEYKNSVNVLKAYPSVSVTVKWEIVSNNEDVICFTVPVKITS